MKAVARRLYREHFQGREEIKVSKVFAKDQLIEAWNRVTPEAIRDGWSMCDPSSNDGLAEDGIAGEEDVGEGVDGVDGVEPAEEDEDDEECGCSADGCA